jgi:hypothetical protein
VTLVTNGKTAQFCAIRRIFVVKAQFDRPAQSAPSESVSGESCVLSRQELIQSYPTPVRFSRSRPPGLTQAVRHPIRRLTLHGGLHFSRAPRIYTVKALIGR